MILDGFDWPGFITSAILFIALLVTEYRRREARDEADHCRWLYTRRRR